MRYMADLHTHTTASDGQYAPTELVRMAKGQGLEAIAITDHDTVDGLWEAVQAGKKYGLRIIQGIELSAKEYPTFHILGYGITPDAPVLLKLCKRMKSRREERNERLLMFLYGKGIGLSLSEVTEIAGGDIIGRPHFAQAMVRHGYVSTNREAFDRYLDTVEYHEKVEGGKPSAQECIEAIKASEGKVSLAHPYQIGISCDELDILVKKLKDLGLDAIECFYPKYTAEEQKFYLHLANKYQLHCTGGSDFHGERVKPDVELAALKLELDWILNSSESATLSDYNC